MDDTSFPPNNSHLSMFGNIDEFMDQLFDDGYGFQTIPLGSNISRPEPQTSISMCYSPPFKYSIDVMSVSPDHQAAGKRKWDFSSSPVDQKPAEEDEAVDCPDQSQNLQKAIQAARKYPFLWESDALNTVWIAPRANPGPPPSVEVKQRLMRAILQFKELSEDKDVLIQIWVPIKIEHKNFLTTVEQPYFHDPAITRLVNYRNVSETYQFSVDEESKEALGLPGRVYLGKTPEWTPDVRFFGPDEYPRISYARKYDVRGSIALPVFEKGSANCLGVAELVMTTRRVNYRPQVETLCRALEAVDLKSSDIHRASDEKAPSESYKAALPEILNVLRIVCDKHDLPLAQTWAPCIQQSKSGCWNFDKKSHCISIIDPACYVRDPRVSGFQEACSEHHLLGNQGIVGQAFETNQPSFAADVTAFSKSDYPLAHHGKMFGLRAAVAVRVRSVYNHLDKADFVLELFLPLELQDAGLAFHLKVIRSLSMVIEESCQNLRLLFIPEEGIQRKPLFSFKELIMPLSSDGGKVGEDGSRLESGSRYPCSNSNQELGRSWISDMVEAKCKGKEVAVSLGFREEEQKDGFKLITSDWNDSDTEMIHGQLFPGFANMNHDYGVEEVIGDASFGERLSLGSPAARRAKEKRKTKAHKTVSLQVLRQYFSGSLKDAAKDIGVCPTTLKRICRQHGISRWPSRKIKKVGHSLKKLQMVIDSVQGAEGAIKLSSFYSNFPALGSPNFSSTNGPSNTCADDQTARQTNDTLPGEADVFCSGASTSKSPSTSSSQASGSSRSISKGVKTPPTTANAAASAGNGGDAPRTENPPVVSLKRARSEAHLHRSHRKVTNDLLQERSKSNINRSTADRLTLETRPPVLAAGNCSTSFGALRDGGPFKAKATCGGETIRFSILPNMGFGDVQLEIGRRFNIDDVTRVQIKYLDDCKEWVLLTCDADLDECIDIQRSSGSRTAKLSVHRANSRLQGTSNGSSGQS